MLDDKKIEIKILVKINSRIVAVTQRLKLTVDVLTSEAYVIVVLIKCTIKKAIILFKDLIDWLAQASFPKQN